MVVVKGFGEEPMTLLTSLPVNGSFESMWRIVEGYLTRWRIEETIRFVKQAYGFENVRVHSYRGIRNMASIVLAPYTPVPQRPHLFTPKSRPL